MFTIRTNGTAAAFRDPPLLNHQLDECGLASCVERAAVLTAATVCASVCVHHQQNEHNVLDAMRQHNTSNRGDCGTNSSRSRCLRSHCIIYVRSMRAYARTFGLNGQHHCHWLEERLRRHDDNGDS